MNKPIKKKDFDSIEMKRKIQEQIAEETEGMTYEELKDYYRKRIANSRFAGLFESEKTANTKEVI